MTYAELRHQNEHLRALLLTANERATVATQKVWVWRHRVKHETEATRQKVRRLQEIQQTRVGVAADLMQEIEASMGLLLELVGEDTPE